MGAAEIMADFTVRHENLAAGIAVAVEDNDAALVEQADIQVVVRVDLAGVGTEVPGGVIDDGAEPEVVQVCAVLALR